MLRGDGLVIVREGPGRVSVVTEACFVGCGLEGGLCVLYDVGGGLWEGNEVDNRRLGD